MVIETLSKTHLSAIRKKQGVYHGLTIISRRKTFYDCTTFAMSERHPSPAAYYFQILKDLQKFVELFPTMARSLIQKESECQRYLKMSSFLQFRNVPFHAFLLFPFKNCRMRNS